MGASIVSGLILGFCALLMFGIGIVQIKSKKPAGFYSGVKPPDENELTDVNAWNKRHGIMWIMYGVCIIISLVCGLFMGNSLMLLIPFLICLLLPIPFMAFYHNKLVKKYYVIYQTFQKQDDKK